MSKNSSTISPSEGSISCRERASCQVQRRGRVLLVFGADPSIEGETFHDALDDRSLP